MRATSWRRTATRLFSPTVDRRVSTRFAKAKERNEPFTIVITDLGMPYVDGRRVASEVKRALASHPGHFTDRLGPAISGRRRYAAASGSRAEQTAEVARIAGGPCGIDVLPGQRHPVKNVTVSFSLAELSLDSWRVFLHPGAAIGNPGTFLPRIRLYKSGAKNLEINLPCPVRPCNVPSTMRLGINTFLFTSPFTTQSVKLFPVLQELGL